MKRLLAIVAFGLRVMNGFAGEARDDLGLREFLLNDGFSVYAETNEVCYISFGSKPRTNSHDVVSVDTPGEFLFGSTPGTNSHDVVSADPPGEFLQRFAGRHFSVRKASEYPKTSKNWRSFENNPKTGVPDGLYTAEIVEWINDTTARVKYSMYRAPLWAAGYEAVAEKKDGKWRIKKYLRHWVA